MTKVSANHAPAVTPIITEDSNPMSDRGRPFHPYLYRHKRPLREKTTGAYGRSNRQPCFTNPLSRLEPSVRQCNPAVPSPPTPSSLPSSNHRHRNVISPLPPKTRTVCQAKQSSLYQRVVLVIYQLQRSIYS